MAHLTQGRHTLPTSSTFNRRSVCTSSSCTFASPVLSGHVPGYVWKRPARPHCPIRLRAAQELYLIATPGGVLEIVGAGALWVFVAVSAVYATWGMGKAFLDARVVVNRRNEKPELEERERQKRIDKLFGRK